MASGPDAVTVVAASTSVLGVALTAGLARRGWEVAYLEQEHPPPTLIPAACVVVVDDDNGATRVRIPPTVNLHASVCIGSIASLAVLCDLHLRGATVLHSAVAFVPLLHLVERCLQQSASAPAQRTVVSPSLLRRRRECAALATLTPTERQVLAAMVAGLTASEIGKLRHVALSTVRSHVRSILAKLDVTTQLAAVAVARRSAPGLWADEEFASFVCLSDAASASGVVPRSPQF